MSAVVTGLRAVEQGLTDAVFKLHLLQQVLHFGVGELRSVVVGVGHVTAVIVGQRVEAQSDAGAGQGCDEQTGYALEDVEGGLGQTAHSRVKVCCLTA